MCIRDSTKELHPRGSSWQEGCLGELKIEATSALGHSSQQHLPHHISTSHTSNTHSTFTYTMANMISMAFLTTNELHNVVDRMDPIIKSVRNELAVRAEQADSFTDQEDMAGIEQPLQDDPFMAPLLNEEMDNELCDYEPQSSTTS